MSRVLCEPLISSETTKPRRHRRHLLIGNTQNLLIESIENCFNVSIFFCSGKSYGGRNGSYDFQCRPSCHVGHSDCYAGSEGTAVGECCPARQ